MSDARDNNFVLTGAPQPAGCCPADGAPDDRRAALAASASQPESARGEASQDFPANTKTGGAPALLNRIDAMIASIAPDDPRGGRKVILLDRISVLAQSALAEVAFVKRCDAVLAAGGVLHPVTAERRALARDAARADVPRIARLVRRWRAMQQPEGARDGAAVAQDPSGHETDGRAA